MYYGSVLLWESVVSAGHCDLRKVGQTERKVMDKLYEEYCFYYAVIEKGMEKDENKLLLNHLYLMPKR